MSILRNSLYLMAVLAVTAAVGLGTPVSVYAEDSEPVSEITVSEEESLEEEILEEEEVTGTWKWSQGKWWYSYSDGSYLANGIYLLDGAYYKFDAFGWMQTGWIKEQGYWYYFRAGGAMATGWTKVGSSWYYMNEDGVMQTGWVKIGSTWYYMNTSGAMQTGWLKSGSTWYYLKSGGGMATGWTKVGSTWYYMNASGVMQTGWVKIGSTWYYMNASGAMQTGWLKSGSIWYYLKAGGDMATGWTKVGSTWYYMNTGGAMQTGWVQYHGEWYYLNTSGAMKTGWLITGGYRYYLDNNGKMLDEYTKKIATGMSAENKEVLRNIIGGLETGGLVYGNQDYSCYVPPERYGEATVTLGAFCFYAQSAQKLMQNIFDADTKAFRAIDKKGSIESKLKTDWYQQRWSPNQEDKETLIQLLSSPVGKKCQDELFDAMVKDAVEYCEKNYTTDTRALFMYVDLTWHGGSSAAKRIFNALGGDYSLDHIFAVLKKDQDDPTPNQVGDLIYWNRRTMFRSLLEKYIID